MKHTAGQRIRTAYRAEQESSLILHEAAVKALKAAGWQAPQPCRHAAKNTRKLQAQKEALYADYGKLKKQVKEYDVIKQNIDSILRRESEPERGKEMCANKMRIVWKSPKKAWYMVMQSANFSIPVSIQICNFSMNAVLFRRFACCFPAFLAVWGGQ